MLRPNWDASAPIPKNMWCVVYFVSKLFSLWIVLNNAVSTLRHFLDTGRIWDVEKIDHAFRCSTCTLIRHTSELKCLVFRLHALLLKRSISRTCSKSIFKLYNSWLRFKTFSKTRHVKMWDADTTTGLHQDVEKCNNFENEWIFRRWFQKTVLLAPTKRRGFGIAIADW